MSSKGDAVVDTAVPQISGQRPATGVKAVGGAEAQMLSEDETTALQAERQANAQQQIHAASTIAVSFRHSQRKQQKQQLELKAAGMQKIYSLMDQADQLVADANWLRAEQILREVLISGKFEQWLPEPDDYAELHEILVCTTATNGIHVR